ncbi:MAG: T9SS type A sorting domain-containing protein, partial [Bacteroidota bacterium]
QGYSSADFGANQININTATTICYPDITDAITALPVEFISFTARPNRNTVQLNWATATESGNSHFEVERSIDGRIYENIGRVNGAGNTTEVQEYTFVDQNPKAGTNFYRLRQVDFDGRFDYSSIVIAQIGEETGNEILAFPNPLQGDELTLTLNGDWDGTISSATLVDINGRQMATFSGLTTGSTTLRLPNKLPAGVYQLIATNGNEQQAIRLVIQ